MFFLLVLSEGDVVKNCFQLQCWLIRILIQEDWQETAAFNCNHFFYFQSGANVPGSIQVQIIKLLFLQYFLATQCIEQYYFSLAQLFLYSLLVTNLLLPINIKVKAIKRIFRQYIAEHIRFVSGEKNFFIKIFFLFKLWFILRSDAMIEYFNV